MMDALRANPGSQAAACTGLNCRSSNMRANRLLYLMKRAAPAARHPIRVAHVGAYAPETAGGVQKTIAGLADHLPHFGVQVEFWRPSSEIAEPRLTHIDNLRVLELPARRRPANATAGLSPRPKRLFVSASDKWISYIFTPCSCPRMLESHAYSTSPT